MLQIGLMLLCATTICGLGGDSSTELTSTAQTSAPAQQSMQVASKESSLRDLLKVIDDGGFRNFVVNMPRKVPLETPLFGACVNPKEVTDQTYCPVACNCCTMLVDCIVPHSEELSTLLETCKRNGFELVQDSPACLGMTCSADNNRCYGITQYSNVRNEECCGMIECSSCCMGKVLAGCFSPCCGQSEFKFYLQYKFSDGKAILIDLGKLSDWQGQEDRLFSENVTRLKKLAGKADNIKKLFPLG